MPVLPLADLTLPARLGGRLAVLADGRIRESGPADRLLTAPSDPVTAELLAAVPTLPTARTTEAS